MFGNNKHPEAPKQDPLGDARDAEKLSFAPFQALSSQTKAESGIARDIKIILDDSDWPYSQRELLSKEKMREFFSGQAKLPPNSFDLYKVLNESLKQNAALYCHALLVKKGNSNAKCDIVHNYRFLTRWATHNYPELIPFLERKQKEYQEFVRLPLAAQLDEAYKYYKQSEAILADRKNHSDENLQRAARTKEDALGFLQRILDVDDIDAISLLMKKREQFKSSNPNYIPGAHLALSSLTEPKATKTRKQAVI